jgi:hypothetical protein
MSGGIPERGSEPIWLPERVEGGANSVWILVQ